MKLAAVSEGLASDFLSAARIAAGIGLDALSIRRVDGVDAELLDDDRLRLVRRIADDHGLEIAVLSSPYGRGFYLDDDTAPARAESLLRRAVDSAGILGTRLVRVFTPWLRDHDSPDSWATRPSYPGCLDELAAAMAPSVALAESAGVSFMIELEGAAHVGRLDEMAQLLSRLDSPAVSVCWDVANGWRAGEPPVPDGLATALRLPVVEVQTKDLHRDPHDPTRATTRKAVLGEGDIAYPVILRALAENGYAGYVTVERIYHDDTRAEDVPTLQRDAIADVENLRRMVADSLVTRP